MTHDTCTPILQCLVSCSCRKSSAKKAIQGHSGQMSSKTILIGLSIFRCSNEKFVYGRPSWEFAPCDCISQISVQTSVVQVQNCFKGRREQHNEGWESGGKGAQKYERRENVVREAGDSDPPVPPPSPTKC